MKSVSLRYLIKGIPVIIQVSAAGEIIGLYRNGEDKTEDGNVIYETIEALKERGVNLQEAIGMAFENQAMQTARCFT